MLGDCKGNQGKTFVAIDRNKVVGFVSGFVQEYDERDKLDYSCPKKGIVAELIGDKNCRANGIGTELLKYIENDETLKEHIPAMLEYRKQYGA